MDEWVVYHDPRCGKSRMVVEMLEERGIEPRVLLIQQQAWEESSLSMLARRLGIHPGGLVRTNHPLWSELRTDLEDDGAILRLLRKYPVLLERPIVSRGERAVIGRPPNRVLELLPDPI